MNKKTEGTLKMIHDHFANTPVIIVSIGLDECGCLNSLSRKGLFKKLEARNNFIKEISKHVSKELMDSIYNSVNKNIKYTDEDYTRESKRIDCETPCKHLDIGEHMGAISFCNKYLRGEEDKCRHRTYLS